MKYKTSLMILVGALILFACNRNENDLSKTSNISLENISDKYPKWREAFNYEFNLLRQHVEKNSNHREIFKIDNKTIEDIMHSSVSPNSKMINSLNKMIDTGEIPQYGRIDGPLSYPLFRDLIPLALQKATPSGIGGIYKPSNNGFIVYLEFNLPADKNPFKNNNTPAHDKFVRNQKVFLIYKHLNGELKLWSLSKEFIILLRAMRKTEIDKIKDRYPDLTL